MAPTIRVAVPPGNPKLILLFLGLCGYQLTGLQLGSSPWRRGCCWSHYWTG